MPYVVVKNLRPNLENETVMQNDEHKSVIGRSDAKGIKRAKYTKGFREQSEVKAAYEQVGWTPNRNTKSWYRDIYEFYQQNEV